MNILENILNLPLVCCHRSQSTDDSSDCLLLSLRLCIWHGQSMRPSDWWVEEAACSTALNDWLIELLNLLNGTQWLVSIGAVSFCFIFTTQIIHFRILALSFQMRFLFLHFAFSLAFVCCECSKGKAQPRHSSFLLQEAIEFISFN